MMASTIRSVLRVPQFVNFTRGLSTSGASLSKVKGRINAKKPMRVEVVEGKRYLWCACGYSKNQPWCDGTHLWRRWSLKIKQTPVMFKAPKTGQVSLCTCKQTDKAPYCDGAHRRKEIQEAVIE
ncbi:CDGSH iron-sulfur domain-containing protein 3, mitochondrial-like [Macrobrachium rosenbergii]|uniref:CDGSH iron-sulfur domain-containing protein 3, mitochondrial-like n=1 Tax=Macrobrachium rosenbergii TaxID=79674 RepID=UPI0034D45964